MKLSDKLNIVRKWVHFNPEINHEKRLLWHKPILNLAKENKLLENEITEAKKKSANKIYQSLIMVNKLTKENNNSSKFIIEKIFSKLNKDPLITVEYIKIVDPISFNQITTISKNNLLVLAVKIGKARLIDNININTN